MFFFEMTKFEGIITVVFVFLISLPTSAHERHAHESAADQVTKVANSESQALQEINIAYLKDVKPLFRKSCFDCHTSLTRYPWYSSLPFVKSMIVADITEARKHLDFSSDFPFIGHGTPREDLVAIADTVTNRTMPPSRYLMLHPSARLSDSEHGLIKQWVDNSLKILRE